MIASGELTEGELRNPDEQVLKLTGLVEARYAISRD